MSGINGKRLLLGGLVAGLFVNITETFFNMVLMAKPFEEALKALNLPPMDPRVIGFYVAWGFAQGLLSVWLYAAIRPRYGEGPLTAIRVGLVIWFLAYLWPGLSNAFLQIMPMKATLMGAGWGLVEAPLTAMIGAWLYRE
jgi:hypothetical protein